MNAFCASVNCDAFIAFRSFSPAGFGRGKLYLTSRTLAGGRLVYNSMPPAAK
jgi:hypothetical protein